jgi:hypothetical protein
LASLGIAIASDFYLFAAAVLQPSLQYFSFSVDIHLYGS